jgi:hypothetical protein
MKASTRAPHLKGTAVRGPYLKTSKFESKEEAVAHLRALSKHLNRLLRANETQAGKIDRLKGRKVEWKARAVDAEKRVDKLESTSAVAANAALVAAGQPPVGRVWDGGPVAGPADLLGTALINGYLSPDGIAWLKIQTIAVNVNTPSMFDWRFPEGLYQLYDQALSCEGSRATVRLCRGPSATKRGRITKGRWVSDVENRCNDPSIMSQSSLRNWRKSKYDVPVCGIVPQMMQLCVEHLQSIGFVCAPPRDLPQLDGSKMFESVAMLLVDVHKTDTVPHPASASQTLNPCSGSGITGFWAVLQVLPLWGRAEGVECEAQVLAYDEGENQLRGLIGRRRQSEAARHWRTISRGRRRNRERERAI